MMRLYAIALAAFLFPIVLGLLVFAPRWYRFIRARRRDKDGNHLRCHHCGYDVSRQRMPRCPECGCAIGFDCSFEDLGVSEQDVIEHVESRHRQTRQQQGE